MLGERSYSSLVIAMLGLAGVTFVALRFVVAPYGRHARGGWGPTIPEKLGWALMESPSLVLFSALFWSGSRSGDWAARTLWAMWTVHYAHRALLYPLRLPRTGKRMPAVIALLAIIFNVLNSTLNGGWLGSLSAYPEGWLMSPQFLLGATMFVGGMAINLDADRRLFALRAPGERGYKVPRGGLYDYVASPNYLGELLEWSGWALASASWGGLAFAVYTFANLAPRARSHLAWYRATFPEYPPERKALVPFVW